MRFVKYGSSRCFAVGRLLFCNSEFKYLVLEYKIYKKVIFWAYIEVRTG